MGALMMIAHLAKIVAFGFIGFAIGRYVPLMVAMIATGAVGNWIGEVALLRTSEQRFRLVLQLALTMLGLRLLWGAARRPGGSERPSLHAAVRDALDRLHIAIGEPVGMS